MKKTSVLLGLITTIFFAISVTAQELAKTFVPYYLEKGKVESFERIGSKVEAKSIGYGGFGGTNSYLTVFNSKNSPLRFNAGDLPKFIIKVDKGVDVFELVIISKADIVKKKKTYRRFIQGGSSYGGGAKDLSKYVTIPILKKMKENIYEMTFSDDLEPGEYAFQPIFRGSDAGNIRSTSGSTRIYCFGVD